MSAPDQNDEKNQAREAFEKETGLKNGPQPGSKEEDDWFEAVSISSKKNRADFLNLLKMAAVSAAIFISGLFLIDKFMR